VVAIEKGIPIPEVVPARKPNVGYPFLKMERDDSFLHPGPMNVAARACWYHHHRSGYKFTCRTVTDGIRIWRIA